MLLILACFTRGMTITEHASSGKVFLCSATVAVVRAGGSHRFQERALAFSADQGHEQQQ
jgi:hypothetical protein